MEDLISHLNEIKELLKYILIVLLSILFLKN